MGEVVKFQRNSQFEWMVEHLNNIPTNEQPVAAMVIMFDRDHNWRTLRADMKKSHLATAAAMLQHYFTETCLGEEIPPEPDDAA